MKSYTWSSFSWSAQSCSTSCNKAAAFRLKRMLQAFFNPQTTKLLNQCSGKVLRYVLDYRSSCSIHEFCSSCSTLFFVFFLFLLAWALVKHISHKVLVVFVCQYKRSSQFWWSKTCFFVCVHVFELSLHFLSPLPSCVDLDKKKLQKKLMNVIPGRPSDSAK